MKTKLLYQDDYVNIVLEEETNIVIDTWNEKSGNLSTQEFKDILLIFKQVFKESNAALLLSDSSFFMVPITPDLQEWIVNTISIPLVQETNYCKQAFVMPTDFIANLSIEQFTDESNSNSSNAVSIRYFDNLQEAKKWLLE